MKNLQNLGKILNKQEQQSINGGDNGSQGCGSVSCRYHCCHGECLPFGKVCFPAPIGGDK